jgi:SAM-dependent methyltransferase
VGVWLRSRGVARLDGLDLTPAMLARAEARGCYQRTFLGDLRRTGLPAQVYDLAVQSLADEHLPALAPLYREVARLTGPESCFVLIGYHPHFLMNGIPTHFDRGGGDQVTIESHVHLFSDHVKAAHAAGWRLTELEEGIVDDAWIAQKPKWERFRFHPVSYAMVWRRPG